MCPDLLDQFVFTEQTYIEKNVIYYNRFYFLYAVKSAKYFHHGTTNFGYNNQIFCNTI